MRSQFLQSLRESSCSSFTGRCCGNDLAIPPTNGYLTRSGRHVDLELIIALHFVDDGRDGPTRQEQQDNEDSKEAETIIQITDLIPDRAAQVQLCRQNVECLEAAYDQGYRDNAQDRR